MVSTLGDYGVVSFSYRLGVLPSTCDRNQRKYIKLGVTETFPPREARSGWDLCKKEKNALAESRSGKGDGGKECFRAQGHENGDSLGRAAVCRDQE